MLSILIISPFLGLLCVIGLNYIPSEIITIENRKILMKKIALQSTIITFLVSLVVWYNFDNTAIHFQLLQEYNPLYFFELNLGIDGISLPFILLTTLTMPICLLCSWNNIKEDTENFLIIFLFLETLLLLVFEGLDLLLFYIFFESVLPPLFLLIGVWGHGTNKVRASYLLFLYTLMGSLFMLLSILGLIFVVGSSNYHLLFLTDFTVEIQRILWIGFFIALAIKTPLFLFIFGYIELMLKHHWRDLYC